MSEPLPSCGFIKAIPFPLIVSKYCAFFSVRCSSVGSVVVEYNFTKYEKYYFNSLFSFSSFKDTHREKTPSNKTPVLRKSMTINILTVGTLNQIFISGSYTERQFCKNYCHWQDSLLCDRSILCSSFFLS